MTKAEAYMNDNQYVAELRQILGDIQSVHCLSAEDIVIIGSNRAGLSHLPTVNQLVKWLDNRRGWLG